MSFESFTFCPPDMLDKALRYLAGQTGDSTDVLLMKVDAALSTALKENRLAFFRDDRIVPDENDADAVQFATGLAVPNGDEIVAMCLRNKRPGSAKWFGLIFKIVPKLDTAEGFLLGDLYFPNWADGPAFLEALAGMAIKEKWSYTNFASKLKHPILRSHIAKTYERLKQQQQLLKEGNLVLFNTGLIDRFFKEVYVICELSPEHEGRLLHARPVLESDRIVLERFRTRKPALATFFSSITDVVFDPGLEIITNDAHIIEENWDRIPDSYRQMPKGQVFALFQAAIGHAKVMARRNYKLVVPQFYNGQIQFLMPIYLSSEFSGTPDCALTLEGINGDCYRGNTILTLDMAYQNARLIAKPDPTWLDPDTVQVMGGNRPV
ncbi:MAG TPA: DUF3825 domain-containing protein [Symbiobacteriaceae bacterium]